MPGRFGLAQPSLEVACTLHDALERFPCAAADRVRIAKSRALRQRGWNVGVAVLHRGPIAEVPRLELLDCDAIHDPPRRYPAALSRRQLRVGGDSLECRLQLPAIVVIAIDDDHNAMR